MKVRLRFRFRVRVRIRERLVEGLIERGDGFMK